MSLGRGAAACTLSDAGAGATGASGGEADDVEDSVPVVPVEAVEEEEDEAGTVDGAGASSDAEAKFAASEGRGAGSDFATSTRVAGALGAADAPLFAASVVAGRRTPAP